MFHCRELANGKLRAFEINDFEQDDLVTDDVLILDSGDEIYVWIGKDANDNEREKSMELAKVRICITFLKMYVNWRSTYFCITTMY